MHGEEVKKDLAFIRVFDKVFKILKGFYKDSVKAFIQTYVVLNDMDEKNFSEIKNWKPNKKTPNDREYDNYFKLLGASFRPQRVIRNHNRIENND